MLTKMELADYRRDGFLFPRRVISAAEADSCKSRLDAYIDRFGDDARGRGVMTKRPHILLRWVAELARRPEIVDAVEDIIGPDILCWSSAFFTKEARSDRFVSWHQDANYWGLSSDKVVSAWISLTPSTVENGCMRFLPGSHRALLRHHDAAAAENMLSRGQTVSDRIDEGEAVDVRLDPGEFALFHVNLAHTSPPNRSREDRVGLVFRYVAGDVRQTKADFDSASLIRGRDLAGFFEHEPMPTADLDPAALALHERVCGARQKVYFS
jgi:non-heme Fe2+,alpha-ketoglutarate-dependent halogenase